MRTVLYVVELDIFFLLYTGILACTHLCYVAETHAVQGSIIDHRQNSCIYVVRR